MSSEQRELAKHEADDVVRALCLDVAAALDALPAALAGAAAQDEGHDGPQDA